MPYTHQSSCSIFPCWTPRTRRNNKRFAEPSSMCSQSMAKKSAATSLGRRWWDMTRTILGNICSIYMYIYTTHVYIYIYIYTTYMYIYIYIFLYIYILYIYIFIYIYIYIYRYILYKWLYNPVITHGNGDSSMYSWLSHKTSFRLGSSVMFDYQRVCPGMPQYPAICNTSNYTRVKQTYNITGVGKCPVMFHITQLYMGDISISNRYLLRWCDVQNPQLSGHQSQPRFLWVFKC